MFKIYYYVFSEVCKQTFKLRNLLIHIFGGLFGLAFGIGTVWLYLDYKISLGGNIYINTRLLTFVYENKEIVKFQFSRIYFVLTVVLGFLFIRSLPWFKPIIDIDEDKIDKMLDEVLEDEFDDDSW